MEHKLGKVQILCHFFSKQLLRIENKFKTLLIIETVISLSLFLIFILCDFVNEKIILLRTWVNILCAYFGTVISKTSQYCLFISDYDFHYKNEFLCV